MGLYDVYDKVQLKVGDYEKLSLKQYKIGDRVRIPDGVYVGMEGVVVVLKRKLVACFKKIYDKWGNELDLWKILGVSDE